MGATSDNSSRLLPASRCGLRRRSKTLKPVLRFTPTAWAKLIYLRDRGDTEVGGMGLSAADDLLLVQDVMLIRQDCTWSSVAFSDEAVADFFDRQVDLGRLPEQFFRIWIHTHPGSSPAPSHTDEETFKRVFGSPDWAVMFILAAGGRSYGRLRFNIGPGGALQVPVKLDFSQPFGGSDETAWEAEYLASVNVQDPQLSRQEGTALAGYDSRDDWLWYEQLEREGDRYEW